MKLLMGQFKQLLAKDYQEAYLELFGFGSTNHKIEIIDNKILFFSTHRRITAMKTLDARVPEFTRMIEVILIDEFKETLKQKLKSKYGLQIVTILQDYDPVVEQSATIVFLDREVANYLQ